MARPLWSGSLSFGLVNVPVQMVSAVRDMDVHFHQVDEKSGERIEIRRVCSKEGKEVPWEDVAHGFEVSKGKLVVLTDEELDAAAPERTRTIEISEFVALEEIDPAHFDHPYYLLPSGEGEGALRAYRLLRDVMAGSDLVAIGRVVLRSKEHLVAVRERDDLLALSTMVFADELRDPKDTGAVPSGRKGAPRKAEIDQALELIESMTREFDPSRYEDCHRARLLKIVARKRRGGEVEIPETEPEPDPAPDLIAALEESLERAKAASR